MNSGPFRYFTREEWASLRSHTPLSLSDEELAALRSINERLSLTEVAEAHLPLSRFLNLHVNAAQKLSLARDAFLGRHAIHIFVWSSSARGLAKNMYHVPQFTPDPTARPRATGPRLRSCAPGPV